jgi:hypothetical protein
MTNQKHKKNTNPKILILTQIHPINVAAVYDEIASDFGVHNEVFSPQVMALLGEMSLKTDENDLFHSYRVFNAAFIKNIKAALQKMTPLKPWIIVGNCSKDNTNFDYILGFNGGEDFWKEDNFDSYIYMDNNALKDKDMKINYYTAEDAEIFLPTMHHLKLFLSSIGIKENEKT